jgi:transcriptional regulator with XRE-family HTH domain
MPAKTRAKTKPVINPRSTNAGDKALGDKIRARRILAKMSQAELGSLLGVSFQQIQKYEKGVNRVGAVRLEQIAKALDEDVSYFVGGGTVSKPGLEMQALIADPLNLRICRALSAIAEQSMRFQFVRLIERVSGIAGDGAA